MAQTRLTVLVTEEFRAELEQAAEEEGLDLSNYVRWALRRWLKQQQDNKKAGAADTAPAGNGTHP